MTQKIKSQKGSIATSMAVIIAMCMTILVAGCTSTELVDTPRPTETKGQTITLNISCPEAAQTRADNDHVLRYSALLYNGAELKELTESRLYDRKEILVSDEEIQYITFEVPTGNYSCVVFADYIPSSAQKDKDGFYEDVYYDTHSTERIYMRAFTDFTKQDRPDVDNKCINDDNYDCFLATVENIRKEENELHEPITLERIVSRISFISSTDLPEGKSIKSVTFQQFDFYHYLTIKGQATGLHASAGSTRIGEFEYPITYNQENKEILYFYTLARNDGKEDSGLNEIKFKVNFTDGTSYPSDCFSVRDGLIKPYANLKIMVKGPFLSESPIVLGKLILDIPMPNVDGWETDIDRDVIFK